MQKINDKIIQGDALEVLKSLSSENIDCVVTSPPYFQLRDYGVKGQQGLEKTPEEYIENLCKVFDSVKRVMKKTGTLFVNLGDTYYGGGRNKNNKNPKIKSKTVRGLVNLGDTVPGPKGQAKSLAQIPSRFAIAMTDRGWILRNEIVWQKPNAMPSSATDRFTVDFEKIFFFVRSTRYYFSQQLEAFRSNKYDRARMARGRTVYGNGKWAKESGGAIKTQRAFVAGNANGRNKRCVWSINTKPLVTDGHHYATYPESLVETLILAGSPPGGVVLDPFVGSGTTAVVAKKLGRHCIGIELKPEYIAMAEKRIAGVTAPLFHV